MLSLALIRSRDVFSAYHTFAGHYLAKRSGAGQSDIYYGKGANEAGLIGRVDDAEFTLLLEGHTPGGRFLGRYRGGERQHYSGTILTFSAPKSASLLALVGEDRRITEAHTEAVKAALDYAETNLVQTRRSINGEIVKQSGGKIIAGLFQHDSSRALDPQLHTHAVLTTVGKDMDGISCTLHNDKVITSAKLLGRVYLNEFAHRLEHLGFGIERTRKALFEIKGVSRELVDQFSKRCAAFNEKLETTCLDKTTNANDTAALATRAQENPVDRNKLKEVWRSEVESFGYNIDQVLGEARRSSPNLIEDRSELATRAVDFAVSNLAERNAVYSHASVLEGALNYAPTVSVLAVEQELKFYAQAGVLYAVTRGGELHYTDAESVRLETEITALMKGNARSVFVDIRPVTDEVIRRSSDDLLLRNPKRRKLTAKQKAGVSMVLSAVGRIVIVKGYGGTGKFQMLQAAHRYARLRSHSIEGVAPCQNAVSALSTALANSSTVQRLLTEFDRGINFGAKSKTILVVDDASRLSPETTNRIERMAATVGYERTVFLVGFNQVPPYGIEKGN